MRKRRSINAKFDPFVRSIRGPPSFRPPEEAVASSNNKAARQVKKDALYSSLGLARPPVGLTAAQGTGQLARGSQPVQAVNGRSLASRKPLPRKGSLPHRAQQILNSIFASPETPPSSDDPPTQPLSFQLTRGLESSWPANANIGSGHDYAAEPTFGDQFLGAPNGGPLSQHPLHWNHNMAYHAQPFFPALPQSLPLEYQHPAFGHIAPHGHNISTFSHHGYHPYAPRRVPNAYYSHTDPSPFEVDFYEHAENLYEYEPSLPRVPRAPVFLTRPEKEEAEDDDSAEIPISAGPCTCAGCPSRSDVYPVVESPSETRSWRPSHKRHLDRRPLEEVMVEDMEMESEMGIEEMEDVDAMETGEAIPERAEMDNIEEPMAIEEELLPDDVWAGNEENEENEDGYDARSTSAAINEDVPMDDHYNQPSPSRHFAPDGRDRTSASKATARRSKRGQSGHDTANRRPMDRPRMEPPGSQSLHEAPATQRSTATSISPGLDETDRHTTASPSASPFSPRSEDDGSLYVDSGRASSSSGATGRPERIANTRAHLVPRITNRARRHEPASSPPNAPRTRKPRTHARPRHGGKRARARRTPPSTNSTATPAPNARVQQRPCPATNSQPPASRPLSPSPSLSHPLSSPDEDPSQSAAPWSRSHRNVVEMLEHAAETPQYSPPASDLGDDRCRLSPVPVGYPASAATMASSVVDPPSLVPDEMALSSTTEEFSEEEDPEVLRTPLPGIRARALQRASEKAWALAALHSGRYDEPVERGTPAPPSPALAPVDSVNLPDDVESISLFSDQEDEYPVVPLFEPPPLFLEDPIEESFELGDHGLEDLQSRSSAPSVDKVVKRVRWADELEDYEPTRPRPPAPRFADPGFTIWRDTY